MTRLRAPIARGFSPYEDDWTPENAQSVATADPGNPNRGGRYGAGWIQGAAIVTRGEAAGHDLWLDAEFLASVVDAINATTTGVKSRFQHPNYCADGLGRAVGRVTDAYLDGDTVRADIHFLDAATRAPEGDLPGYLLDLAAEDPTLFGISVAFTADRQAETAFEAANSTTGVFVSPDPDNVNGLCHARLARLHAADVVDEPAANPDGLFSASPLAAAEFADYVLGRSNRRPSGVAGVDPDRARRFFADYLTSRRLSLTETPPTMQTATPAAEPAADLEAASPAAAATPAPEPDQAAPVPTVDGVDLARREAAEYRRRWGTAGLEYWADGLTPDQAADRHAATLQAELDRLRPLSRAGTTPIHTADRAEPPAPALHGRNRFAAALNREMFPGR